MIVLEEIIVNILGRKLNFLYKIALLSLTIMFFLSNTSYILSQSDSTKFEDNKFLFNPCIHSIQIDATTIFLMNQIGGQFDYDVLRSSNKNICIGTRVSVEHYYLGNFIGEVDGSPFTNYNLYARLSGKKDDLCFEVVGGVTYYTTDEPSYLTDKYMFRTGFEIKYGSILDFILKGSTSLSSNSSFIGIGVSLGYDHME